MVFYTNWMVPKGFAAFTLGWFIFIRPNRKGDEGLLAHEQVHVAQFKREPIMFWPKYLLSKKARYAYELEAYRVQLRYRPDRLDAYAEALATKYRLNLPIDFVREELLASN
jgi:Domain of unknown function (DUF4157)